MAKIPVPPHLQSRLAALVNESGCVRVAAERICVQQFQIRLALRPNAELSEELLTFLEVRLQAYEDLPDDFARKQELAALACDIMADAEKDEPLCAGTTIGAGRRDFPNLALIHAEQKLGALFRYVEGVPAPDGRVLVDSGKVKTPVSVDGVLEERTVWTVLPPPAARPGPADAAPVYRALEALERLGG